MAKRKPVNYVDNDRLVKELTEHRIRYYQWLEDLKTNPAAPRPKLSDYVGETILKIIHGLASKPNFSGYTYKEDMIGDAIINCVRYIHNFNPEKSNKAFTYVTTIASYAFLARLEEEKKQARIRYHLFNQAEAAGLYRQGEGDGYADFVKSVQISTREKERLDSDIARSSEKKQKRQQKARQVVMENSPLKDLFGDEKKEVGE